MLSNHFIAIYMEANSTDTRDVPQIPTLELIQALKGKLQHKPLQLGQQDKHGAKVDAIIPRPESPEPLPLHFTSAVLRELRTRTHRILLDPEPQIPLEKVQEWQLALSQVFQNLLVVGGPIVTSAICIAEDLGEIKGRIQQLQIILKGMKAIDKQFDPKQETE